MLLHRARRFFRLKCLLRAYLDVTARVDVECAMKTVWRVFSYLKRHPWMAVGTLTCAVLSTLMVIVFPATTKWIINDVVRANRPDKLLPLIYVVTLMEQRSLKGEQGALSLKTLQFKFAKRTYRDEIL